MRCSIRHLMRVAYLGKSGFREVLALQHALLTAKVKRQKERQILQRRAAEEALTEPLPPLLPDTVLVVEHDPGVYTMGRRDTSVGFRRTAPQPDGKTTADGRHATIPSAHDGIEVVKIARGGGLTWHGPGQLTVYPVCNVQALWSRSTAPAEVKGKSPLRWYTTVLERAMINTAAAYGVEAHVGCVGIWVPAAGSTVSRETAEALAKGTCTVKNVNSRKLGSIGLQMSDWVSMHGLGFNVCNDLEHFRRIVMCEMPDKDATSLLDHLGPSRCPALPDVAATLVRNFVAALEQPQGFAEHVKAINEPCEAWASPSIAPAVMTTLKGELVQDST